MKKVVVMVMGDDNDDAWSKLLALIGDAWAHKQEHDGVWPPCIQTVNGQIATEDQEEWPKYYWDNQWRRVYRVPLAGVPSYCLPDARVWFDSDRYSRDTVMRELEPVSPERARQIVATI